MCSSGKQTKMTTLCCLACCCSLQPSIKRFLWNDDSSEVEDESWRIGGRFFLNYEPAQYNEMRRSHRGFQAADDNDSDITLEATAAKRHKTSSGIAPFISPVHRHPLENVFDTPSLSEIPPMPAAIAQPITHSPPFSLHLATELQNVPKFPDFFHYSSDDEYDLNININRSDIKARDVGAAGLKQGMINSAPDELSGSLSKPYIVPSSTTTMLDDHTGFSSRPPLAIPSKRTAMFHERTGLALKPPTAIPSTTTTMLEERIGFTMKPSPDIPLSSTTMAAGRPGISFKPLATTSSSSKSTMGDERPRFALYPSTTIPSTATTPDQSSGFALKPSSEIPSSMPSLSHPVAASLLTSADINRLRNRGCPSQFAVPSSQNRIHVALPPKLISSTFGERHETVPLPSRIAQSGLRKTGAPPIRTGVFSLDDRRATPAQSESDARRFACSSCSARFTRRANLNRHQLVHTRDRPFKCPLCAQVFSLSGNLKRHLNNVHKTTQTPPPD